MSNNEYEVFKNNYLQHPITFLTEENLDKLETHCRKAIHYERGLEHQVVLELLERHKEHLAEREQDKKRIKELEEENRIFKDSNVLVNRYFKLKDNSIPVQKVKDKIEENNKIMIDTQNKYPGTYAMLDEWRNAKAQNDILEELLEDK